MPLLVIILAIVWLGVPIPALGGESLVVVDAGFVTLEGYASEAGGEADLHPEDELQELSSLLKKSGEGIERISREFLIGLMDGHQNLELVGLAGGSLNRESIDPEQVLLWMVTVRQISRSFDDRQPRPELHFEFYLINPASQFIAFKQSVTVSLMEVNLSSLTAKSLQAIEPALENALSAEAAVKDRFSASCQNYLMRGAARLNYAVSTDSISFSNRLKTALSKAASASGRGAEAVFRDAQLVVASELNTIFSDEGMMLPVLPTDAMQLMRQGEVSGRSLWMRFNCDVVMLNDLPNGAIAFNRSADLVLISAKLPSPDFTIGAHIDYFEDFENARRRPVPPAFYPPATLTAEVHKRLASSERKLPMGQLSGNANPRYGGAEAPDLLLRGFSAALRSVYLSEN